MPCENDAKRTRSSLSGPQRRLLTRIQREGPCTVEDLAGWLTPRSTVRSELIRLLDGHLVAPVAAWRTEVVESPNLTVTVTAGGRSMSTNQVHRTVVRSTPHDVATGELRFALTSTGSDAIFAGIRVRGSRVVPDRGWHWVCPRGTALRRVAADRLAAGGAPAPAPSELDDMIDEFVHMLTTEHTERSAYAELRAPRPRLDGFSFAEQLRAGDRGVDRAVVELGRHLVEVAAREYRGPLGAERARHADPQMVRISRGMRHWAYRQGYGERPPGRPGWCCSSPGEHDLLGLADRIDVAALSV